MQAARTKSRKINTVFQRHYPASAVLRTSPPLAPPPGRPASPSRACTCSSHAILRLGPASLPFSNKVRRIDDQTDVERHHRQGRGFERIVGPAHQVARNDYTVIVVAGIECRIEHAAIRKPAIEHDNLDAHVAEKKVEVGWIEGREPLLGRD